MKDQKPWHTELAIEENTLTIGVSNPFKIIHVTDSHLTFIDEYTSKDILKMIEQRTGMFSKSIESLQIAVDLAQKHNATIVHTGDIMDFISQPNLDYARKYIQENEVIFAAGNHEFLYDFSALEAPDEHKKSIFKTIEKELASPLNFSFKVINGVNFIALDNSFYQFNEEQLERLKKEALKGLPIVLCMHNPLYEENFFDYKYSVWGERCAALVGVPEKKLELYSQENAKAHRANPETTRFIEYIAKEKTIKAVLCGHTHVDYQSILEFGIPQISTGLNTIRIITIQ